VSTDAIELNGVFSPDQREFYFTRVVNGVDTMYQAVRRRDRPEPKRTTVLPFARVSVMSLFVEHHFVIYLMNHDPFPPPGHRTGRETVLPDSWSGSKWITIAFDDPFNGS
jgi:hypothetical protein